MEMTKAQRDTYDTLLRLLREQGIKDVYEGIDYLGEDDGVPYLVFVDKWYDDVRWQFLITRTGKFECACVTIVHFSDTVITERETEAEEVIKNIIKER
jgi:hypothetical protein